MAISTASTSLSEQVLDVLVDLGAGVQLLAGLDLVIVDVADRGDAGEFVLGEDAADVAAAVADADKADGERRVGLRPANEAGAYQQRARGSRELAAVGGR